jgi:hypothetical protein
VVYRTPAKNTARQTFALDRTGLLRTSSRPGGLHAQDTTDEPRMRKPTAIAEETTNTASA